MSDEELINKIKNGDTGLFSVIAERYFDKIFRFTLRMNLGRQEDAEDATAETFYKAYKYIHLYTTQYSFSTWLYRIAKNTVIDSLRKHDKKNVSLEWYTEQHGDPTAALPENVSDKMMVEKSLAYVDDEERSLLVLFYIEGLSIREISDMYKIQENTITVKIKRAKEKIRVRLEKIGIQHYE